MADEMALLHGQVTPIARPILSNERWFRQSLWMIHFSLEWFTRTTGRVWKRHWLSYARFSHSLWEHRRSLWKNMNEHIARLPDLLADQSVMRVEMFQISLLTGWHCVRNTHGETESNSSPPTLSFFCHSSSCKSVFMSGHCKQSNGHKGNGGE